MMWEKLFFSSFYWHQIIDVCTFSPTWYVEVQYYKELYQSQVYLLVKTSMEIIIIITPHDYLVKEFKIFYFVYL